MGLPAPVGVSWIGPPPAGDGANAVDSGSFAAIGPSKPVPILGRGNATLWAAYNSALTTVLGSLAASVAAIGAIAAGCGVKSSLVPPGTTISADTGGNNITLALPTVQLQGVLNADGSISGLGSTAWLAGAAVSGPNVPAGAIVAAIETPASFPASSQNEPVTPGVPIVFDATVQLERSFDGASTWLATTNWDAAGGTAAVFTGNASLPFFEAEAGVYYRLNCTVYSAVSGVTLNYRLSATGGASRSLTTGGVI